MAALSIASVTAEAQKQVSPHLTLARLNQENCFEWILSDEAKRNTQQVPVDKIRGLKLDEWLRYARALAGGELVPGAPPPVLDAPVRAAPTGPAGGSNPSFMLLKNKERLIPFDPDPEAQGYKDATRGITACPYGIKHQTEAWNRGHDRAFAEGVAEKERFAKRAGRRN